MQSRFQTLLIGALAVVMVTSAPLSSQEKPVSADQAGEAADRAKRANEEIVFGNQQNKPRVVAKKSDLSNILSPPQPPGELDQGSETIVHKEMAVTEDLAARAQAASGSLSENNEKMKEAVEAALESVAETVNAEPEPNVQQQTSSKVGSETNVSKPNFDAEVEENEQGAGEVNDEGTEAQDDDEDLKDLQKAAELNVATEGGSEVGDNGSDDVLRQGNEDHDDDDEVANFLQESQKVDEGGETQLERDRLRSYYENKMRNYLEYLDSIGQKFSDVPPYVYRFRRSPHTNRNTKGNKRARRIKRDLLDDNYYGPYDLQSTPYDSEEESDSLISSNDNIDQLSDEEAEYLYKQLVNYLANGYDQDERNPETDETPLEQYVNGFEESQNGQYTPYDIFNEENTAVVPRPYEDRYPYIPIEFDGYPNYAKRGMIDYYPREEEEKRYFFPFSKEPETHWGAFVPEKRAYGEAIQRLQRLAMALSDNPGPYYREILEEYRKK